MYFYGLAGTPRVIVLQNFVLAKRPRHSRIRSLTTWPKIAERMRLPIILAFVLAVAAAPAAAAIYSLVDENGAARLTELPLEGYMLARNDAPTAALQIDPAAAPTTGTPIRRTARAPAPVPVRVIHRPYSDLVAKVAREQQVDAALLHAVVTVESGYNARALSPKGARGLMQLMPGTAQRFGVKDSWNPLQNLRGGARYLRHLLLVFNNNLNLALAAYNAGEGAVIDSGRTIPPYPETRQYVPRVLERYEFYRGARS